MAALDVSVAVAHSSAAHDLAGKGRFARAVEKYALAANAGLVLGHPDCFVVANAQIREADTLLAAAQSETPERARALRHRALAELTPPVIELVERRRISDTLLCGKCAPHEVEWSRQLLAAAGLCPASKVTLFAHFIGYEAYLRVARLALFWLHLGHKPSDVAPPTPAQTQQIFSCAATALDLMSAPRLEKNASFNYEAALLKEVRDTLRDEAHITREHRDVLAAALGRLLRSGMIEERGMEGTLQDTQRKWQQLKAKVQAEREAPGLQSCAHCGAREVHVAQFKRCSACKAVVFCCKDCQLANWPSHKAACKAARKAAAGGAACV